MADFLNASRPEEIVFGPNMTTLTFRISQAIGRSLAPGDEVVVTRLDHDANIAPWLELERLGLVVRWVDFSDRDYMLDLDQLRAALGPRTKVVAVGYASNAMGTVNPLREIIDLAHDAGALAYIDAVHYAPHGPIDVQALGCDFLVCSAYKFFGPHQGVLFGRHELLRDLPAAKVRPAGDDPPDKFETGTANFEAIAGTTAAVDYLASVGERFGREHYAGFSGFEGRRLQVKAGMTAIRAYEAGLCRTMIAGIKEIPGVTVHGPADIEQRVPTVSITSGKLSPAEMAARLDRENIFTWDGHFYALEAVRRLGLLERGGLLRIGICHFNTSEEVEAIVVALAAMHSA